MATYGVEAKGDGEENNDRERERESSKENSAHRVVIQST